MIAVRYLRLNFIRVICACCCYRLMLTLNFFFVIWFVFTWCDDELYARVLPKTNNSKSLNECARALTLNQANRLVRQRRLARISLWRPRPRHRDSDCMCLLLIWGRISVLVESAAPRKVNTKPIAAREKGWKVVCPTNQKACTLAKPLTKSMNPIENLVVYIYAVILYLSIKPTRVVPWGPPSIWHN